jgi:hypothetical protein
MMGGKIYGYLNKQMPILEKLVLGVTILYPLTAVPQIYKIWVYKEVSGVSILTWFLFLIFIIPLIMYSVAKRERKLTIMWSVWLIVYMVIILGIFVNG